MRHVTSFASSAATTIEVDGSLDVVAAYDLQRCLHSELVRGVQAVGLDLTRVTTMDSDGVQGLRRCCDAAVAVRVVLTLTGCSRPVLDALKTFESPSPRDRTRSRTRGA